MVVKPRDFICRKVAGSQIAGELYVIPLKQTQLCAGLAAQEHLEVEMNELKTRVLLKVCETMCTDPV